MHSHTGVALLAIVDDLQVPEDLFSRVDPRPSPFSVETFGVACRPKKFDHRVAVAVPERSHRRVHPRPFGEVEKTKGELLLRLEWMLSPARGSRLTMAFALASNAARWLESADQPTTCRDKRFRAMAHYNFLS